MPAESREQFIRTLPTIALVGRVNVGKSTLFNKLISEQKAIVATVPGTTRTTNQGTMTWRGREFRVLDTGGLSFDDGVPLEDDILKQSERAMKEADLILFVTDAKTGILPQERDLAKRMRRIIVKNVLLIANKVDNAKTESRLTDKEWYSLGLGEPFGISAVNGRNTGDLLDRICELLPEEEYAASETPAPKADDIINVSLIGKPNVGKSSLFNKIIGEEKVIVSDMAHTTREPHDTLLEYTDVNEETHKINFVDTAGIRRKSKVSGILERLGIFKSIESAGKSDIVLFVVDGSQPISSQDRQLGGLLEKHSRSVIILLNKWDLAEDNSDFARKEATMLLRREFPHLRFAPIIFVSGKTGYRVHQIFPMLMRVWRARQTKIPVKTLEYFLKQATSAHRPARGKGTRHPKLMGIKQLNVGPPIFEVAVKFRTSLHRSYLHYLENKMREQFDFIGTPIVIKLRKTRR